MKQPKMRVLAAAAVAGALAFATLGTAFAQTQPGYGPGCMMGGGQGYAPGGMLRGGPGGMMGGWGTTTGQAQPLTSLDDAKPAFQGYIDAIGNSNLALDEVMQFQVNYYAIVKDTSTGIGA